MQSRLHAVEPPKPIVVTDIAPSSSPPLPGEDNEEAMGNLGLEDTGEVEDQSMRMPEDMAASSAAEDLQVAKREIEEVADSEDEDAIEIGTTTKLPRIPRTHGGFMPSSQLGQESAEEVESLLQGQKAAREGKDGGIDQDDDTLLQN